MSLNEWRITKTTIEAEMLRLAALLSDISRTSDVPAGLAGKELRAANVAIKHALTACSRRA